jgi:diadenosine tetraphosphatase ApaH/serine/threonine PP2A family protein phosphatase
MQALIISDVHANLTALKAVLETAGRYDELWCLGDLVGYGPDPNECVDLLRTQTNLRCLLGNHDQAVLGWIPLARFNREAAQVISWTRETLSEENLGFLEDHDSKMVLGDFTLAHASPREPIWEYIMDARTATANFDHFETDFCLVGHSHIPLIFQKQHRDRRASLITNPEGDLALSPRMILNPGSVGQPRDMDPRAAFALLDTDSLTWAPQRVRYDIAQVQSKIQAAGLPDRQGRRLAVGW